MKLQIANLFCGAGGTSAGACEAAAALGFQTQLTAINHWPVAVATHAENHPDARHLCTGVDDVSTVSSGGGHHGLVTPYIVQVAHKGSAKGRTRSITEPLATVCGNRGDLALSEPMLIPQQSGGRVRSVNEPFIVEYYGTGGSRSVSEPLATVTSKPRVEIAIDGKKFPLDLKFRMLVPRELAAAQGFRGDYVFCGNKTEQVKHGS